MCLQPKGASHCGRINTDLLPPGGFIAEAMDFAVVAATERDRKFITDFAAECRGLRKAQMVSISGPPAADEARLLGD